MNIFTKELINKLPDLKKAHNPFIVAVSRLQGPEFVELRSKINEWIGLLPKEDMQEMIARITSKRDNLAIPAFYELLFLGWFEKKGIPYIKDPKIKEGKPDFLVNPGKEEFYLEIATVFQEKEIAKKERAFHELLDSVDNIRSKYFVGVSLNEWLPEDFNKKSAVAYLKREIGKIDSIKDDSVIEKIFSVNDRAKIEFSIFHKKSKEIGRVLATWSGPGYSGDSCEQVRSRIEEKNKKYKSLKGSKPYVVAICNGGDNFMLDKDSVESALFGRLEVVFNVGPTTEKNNEHVVRRDTTGIITPTPPTFNVVNTRLSGLVYCHWGVDGGHIYISPKYFSNPWASDPINGKVFSDISRLLVVKDNMDGVTLKWFDKSNKKVVLA